MACTGKRKPLYSGGLVVAKLDSTIHHGYTLGMKTAISIPDEIFEKAEHLARRMNKSRSQLFSNAVEEYVDRHSPNHVTEAIDNAWSELSSKTDSFVSEASHRILENSEW